MSGKLASEPDGAWRPWSIWLPCAPTFACSGALIMAAGAAAVMGSWDTPAPGLSSLAIGAAGQGVLAAVGDIRSGVLVDDRQTTLGDYLNRWLEGQQLARKRRTYESYADTCRLYWTPALGHVRLAQLREQHVLDAHKAMRKLNTPAEAGDRSEMLRRLAAARATWHGQRVRTAPLTETTIQRATAVLRAALGDCKAIKVNPAAGIELRVPKRKPVVWTAERTARWRQSGGTWRPGP